MSPNTLPLPATRSPSPATLHGWRLTLARVAWLTIASASVVLLILLIPINLRDFYFDWQFQETYPVVAPYLSRSTYAAYWLISHYSAALACFVAGSLIAWRRPNNPIAWLSAALLMMTPVMFSLGGYTDTWWFYPRPWSDIFRWVRETIAWLGGTLSLISFIFLFPNGRFVPRGLAWVYGLAMVLITLLVAWLFLAGDEIYDYWLITFLSTILIGVVGQIYRYRHLSTPLERQQTKWVVVGFGLWAGTLIVFTPLQALKQYTGIILIIAHVCSWVALVFFAFALAFSVLRYRLWDIDPLINRTLVYGGLTLLVLTLYGAIVFGLGAAFGASGNVLLAVAATGVIAIAFNPLRQRLQRAVNRLMYGERDDPATVLARLGQRLETAIAPEATLSTIAETVAQTLKVPYVAIELTTDDRSARPTTVEHPSSVRRPPSVVCFPLIYHSEPLGQLLVAPRAPGEAFSPADRRLLEQIAQQAAPAVHAYRLTADLHRSRERIIVAREEERRRLRRDLHDNLGPTLASQTFKLDAALEWLDRDPVAARQLFSEVKAQTQATVADIRRLVYELRPPALDELGLVGALRAHVQSLPPANGLRVSVDAPPDLPPLSAAVEVAAYRIALEALTNTLRHAQAKCCSITLTIEKENLRLEIVDDGLGLPREVRRETQDGMGLASMRERADELGGSCVIENRPGGGTRVYVELPILPFAHE